MTAALPLIEMAEGQARFAAIPATRHGYWFLDGAHGRVRVKFDKVADRFSHYLNNVPVSRELAEDRIYAARG
jgi:hypothetical protein